MTNKLPSKTNTSKAKATTAILSSTFIAYVLLICLLLIMYLICDK